MFEKLLPYIQLGINFLNGVLDFLVQIVGLLVSAEGSITGHRATELC